MSRFNYWQDILDTIEVDPNHFLIVAQRHGEKEGDALTARGRDQACQMATNLRAMGFCPERIVCSGANRTRQMGEVSASILGLEVVEIEVDPLFHFSAVGELVAPGNPKAILDELQIVKESGGTVKVALDVVQSAYAMIMRAQIYAGLINLAKRMREAYQKQAVVYSHSPCFELATLYPGITSYANSECTAMAYVVARNADDGTFQLVASLLVPAPFGGHTN